MAGAFPLCPAIRKDGRRVSAAFIILAFCQLHKALRGIGNIMRDLHGVVHRAAIIQADCRYPRLLFSQATGTRYTASVEDNWRRRRQLPTRETCGHQNEITGSPALQREVNPLAFLRPGLAVVSRTSHSRTPASSESSSGTDPCNLLPLPRPAHCGLDGNLGITLEGTPLSAAAVGQDAQNGRRATQYQSESAEQVDHDIMFRKMCTRLSIDQTPLHRVMPRPNLDAHAPRERRHGLRRNVIGAHQCLHDRIRERFSDSLRHFRRHVARECGRRFAAKNFASLNLEISALPIHRSSPCACLTWIIEPRPCPNGRRRRQENRDL